MSSTSPTSQKLVSRHPLQRLASPSRGFSALIHLLGITSFTLSYIKNTLSLCSAPLEVLISVLYWSISAIDRELVVPPEIHIAPIADVGFHAVPSILLTIDLLFLSPPWTIAALPAMGLSSAIAVGYWAWVEQCYKHNGL
jgi:hypothetical protein